MRTKTSQAAGPSKPAPRLTCRARPANDLPVMLYFAYGSNLDFGQLRQRCPSARFVAVAKLPDHHLAFTRFAKDRGCATCDALPQKGRAVWGVVFHLAEADLPNLDRAEGFVPGRPLRQNAYVRVQETVCQDGDAAKPLRVWLYFAVRQRNPSLPNAAYKAQLVAGAKFWRLPENYQHELRRIKVA